MTLKPHQIGDKGQRYEARATNYPKDGENVIGWSDTRDGALAMCDAIARNPRVTHTRVIDRFPSTINEPINDAHNSIEHDWPPQRLRTFRPDPKSSRLQAFDDKGNCVVDTDSFSHETER